MFGSGKVLASVQFQIIIIQIYNLKRNTSIVTNFDSVSDHGLLAHIDMWDVYDYPYHEIGTRNVRPTRSPFVRCNQHSVVLHCINHFVSYQLFLASFYASQTLHITLGHTTLANN